MKQNFGAVIAGAIALPAAAAAEVQFLPRWHQEDVAHRRGGEPFVPGEAVGAVI